jgi:hypothetical protein
MEVLRLHMPLLKKCVVSIYLECDVPGIEVQQFLWYAQLLSYVVNMVVPLQERCIVELHILGIRPCVPGFEHLG